MDSGEDLKLLGFKELHLYTEPALRPIIEILISGSALQNVQQLDVYFPAPRTVICRKWIYSWSPRELFYDTVHWMLPLKGIVLCMYWSGGQNSDDYKTCQGVFNYFISSPQTSFKILFNKHKSHCDQGMRWTLDTVLYASYRTHLFFEFLKRNVAEKTMLFWFQLYHYRLISFLYSHSNFDPWFFCNWLLSFIHAFLNCKDLYLSINLSIYMLIYSQI